MALSYQLEGWAQNLIALNFHFCAICSKLVLSPSGFFILNVQENSLFTMLPQLWFFAILSPLALGVPVHRESVNPSLTPRHSPFNTKVLNSRVNTGVDSGGQWSGTSGTGSNIRLPNSLSTGVPGLGSGTLPAEGFIKELQDEGFFSGGSGQDRGNINIGKSGGTVHSDSSGNGAHGASYSGGEGTKMASVYKSSGGDQNTGSRTATGSEGTPGTNGTVAITQRSGTTGGNSVVQGAQAEA